MQKAGLHSAPRTPQSAFRTAHVYGDDVDTDRIIPGKYTKTLDLSQLAAHVWKTSTPSSASASSPAT